MKSSTNPCCTKDKCVYYGLFSPLYHGGSTPLDQDHLNAMASCPQCLHCSRRDMYTILKIEEAVSLLNR